jgi:ribose 5-phosphate isomerase A
MADQQAHDAQAAMKERAARHAAGLVQDGMIVGLGSGSTATLLVRALAERAEHGLTFIGVPTSEAIADLARSLGLKVTTIEEQPQLDLAIDGADEVDPALNLIKGLGGALLREKIVESAARKLVIIVDASKLVPRLGSQAPVPVEVVPFGWQNTKRALESLGCVAERRMAGADPFVTDGGHYILHCRFAPIADAHDLGARIKALTGVVEHGLFLGMAQEVIVGHPDRVETLRR